MAFLHTCDCSNVPGASGPGVPLCTIVSRDVHFKKKKKCTRGQRPRGAAMYVSTTRCTIKIKNKIKNKNKNKNLTVLCNS